MQRHSPNWKLRWFVSETQMFTHTQIESARDSRCSHRKIQSERLAFAWFAWQFDWLIDWDMIWYDLIWSRLDDWICFFIFFPVAFSACEMFEICGVVAQNWRAQGWVGFGKVGFLWMRNQSVVSLQRFYKTSLLGVWWVLQKPLLHCYIFIVFMSLKSKFTCFSVPLFSFREAKSLPQWLMSCRPES